MGRLVPAGTGLPMYKNLGIAVEADDQVPEGLEINEDDIEKSLDSQVVN